MTVELGEPFQPQIVCHIQIFLAAETIEENSVIRRRSFWG